MLLKQILKEGHKNDAGCLMAIINQTRASQLNEVNKKLIPDKNLYIDPNDPSYGRDTEPHCTLLFGFTTDLSKKQINSIVEGIRPFHITATGISLFKGNGKPYDVVKMDVTINDELKTMRGRCVKYPHQTNFPTYHPHITLAYVKPNTFNATVSNKNITFLIDRIKYSGMDGSKIFIDLKKPLAELDILDQGFLRAVPVKRNS